MKKISRILSLVLALVMVFGLATTAFAADDAVTYSITVPNDGHTYEVYQIFTGDLAADKVTLSNIVWGVNGTGETGTEVDGDIIEELAALRDNASDLTKLDAIEKYVTLSNPIATMNAEKLSENVVPGYYLIKDAAGYQAGENDYSTYIVEIVGPVTIDPKVGKPTLDKEVEEKNDSTGEAGWGDTADYDIGDTINYTLTATLPTNYADYRTFYLQFEDTMDPGLTYNEDAKVYAVKDNTETDITESFTVTTVSNGFTATCIDLKTVEGIDVGTQIVVKYTATLNEDAKIGANGNKNTAGLKYNNDPNWEGDGDPETPDVPENPGETPKDTTIVFTYEVDVNKVDKDRNALEGAGFTLYKWVEIKAAVVDDPDTEEDETAAAEYGWVAVGDEITGGTTFAFEGLDEGKYKLEETTVPDGYNKADDVIFFVESTLDDEAEELDNLTVVDAEGNKLTDFTVTSDLSKIDTTIVNKPGSLLPETGGMGTTIFYIVGGILVLAAVVLLVTRKRMKYEA